MWLSITTFYMQLRTGCAIVIGKCIQFFLRLGSSEGGALPGLIAQRIDPELPIFFAKQCTSGITIVAGTNGKTTVSQLLASVQNEGGLVHNRSGSNMIRGHLSAFLQSCNWSGHLNARKALLEVDEAVLPEALRIFQPKTIILLNLFRDQLDRYGEVDSIAKKWATALDKLLQKDALLCINADDPNLVHLVAQLNPNQIRFFGLNDASISTKKPSSAVDAQLSPVTGKPLVYRHYYLSHLGDYSDPASDFKRPKLNYAAQDIKKATDLNGTTFDIEFSGKTYSLSLPLPGLYNVYNGLAAASTLLAMDYPIESIANHFAQIPGAFGRFERLRIGHTLITLCLIKNPVGASEVLRTLKQARKPINLLVITNDNFADGQDVSWYWDTDVEQIIPQLGLVWCSGSRAYDIALRLQYAGCKKISIAQPIKKAITKVLRETTEQPLYILTTYTAALEVQKILTYQKHKSAYWHA